MAVFKCKMCGGSLEVTEGMTVCECEYCGTQQTLPKTDNEQSLNLFNRANYFRQQCEFDKAAEIYEKMTVQSGADAELYWSLVLCRYGIEYVDDPLTHKKIATCHRTQFKSILDDPDYKTALEYADMAQRNVYEREASYIDKVQKGILEISNKEQPFDVFICYKETDENGGRTPDSVLAQELYYGLTQEGFKVFFSRITLESKLGTEYEPYIFAALNSAKVMVVVGTKPEYFNAVWVRNEWSRYLMLMQEDRSRTLIPAYKDMDPYDLPDALSMFQAQDMSKLGFMQDLIRGIKKIAAPEQEKPVVQQTVIQQTPVNSNIENLLKRGFLALETSKWQEANGFFEQVLNENVEEPRAYIGKLCSEYEVQGEEKLSALQKDFTVSENYKMACRFGGADVEKRLFAYNQQGLYDAAMRSMQAAKSSADYQAVKSRFAALGDFGDAAQRAEECAQKVAEIQEQEEYDRKLSSYLTAEKLMKNGTQHDLEEAADKFRSLSGFKDADELREKCLAKAQEIKSQEKQERQRQQEAAAKKKKLTFIGTASAAAVAALALVTVFVIVPNVKYSNATKLLENGSYTEAEQAFSALGNFKDSPNKLTEIANEKQYQKAIALMESDDLSAANDAFQDISDYKDSAEKIQEIKDKLGNVDYLIEHEKYDEALEIFKRTVDQDSYMKICIAKTVSLAQKGNFKDAYDCYRDYKGYCDMSFDEIMELNGMNDEISNFKDELSKYEGTYNCIDASSLYDKYKGHKAVCTVDTETWSFKVQWDYFQDWDYEEHNGFNTEIKNYPFCFEQKIDFSDFENGQGDGIKSFDATKGIVIISERHLLGDDWEVYTMTYQKQ